MASVVEPPAQPPLAAAAAAAAAAVAVDEPEPAGNGDIHEGGGGDAVESGTDDLPATADADADVPPPAQAAHAQAAHANNNTANGVSFGTVRVHTHRMTLGANPSPLTGVPVELSWSVQESLEFATPSDYFDSYNNTDYDDDHTNTFNPLYYDNAIGVRRIASHSRDAIARAHHTRQSIDAVRLDVLATQQSRLLAARDNDTNTENTNTTNRRTAIFGKACKPKRLPHHQQQERLPGTRSVWFPRWFTSRKKKPSDETNDLLVVAAEP